MTGDLRCGLLREMTAEIFILKAADFVFAPGNGLKQQLIIRIKEIESPERSVVMLSGTGKLLKLVVPGTRIIDGGDEFKITTICCCEKFAECREAVDGILYGSPFGFAASITMFYLTVVFEKGDVIDGGLNAEDERELVVLDGSQPCQGFSTAGKRKMDDGRNQLFREYVRILLGLNPKVFVMEKRERHGQRQNEADLYRDHPGAECVRISCFSQVGERHVFRRLSITAENDFHRSSRGPVELHTGPMPLPIPCGDSLAGCFTPPDQMQKLLEAGRIVQGLSELGPQAGRQIPAGYQGKRIQCHQIRSTEAGPYNQAHGQQSMNGRRHALVRVSPLLASRVQTVRIIPGFIYVCQ